MTEVYHFKSLSGRDFVAVFQDRYLNAAANKYAERYAAGLEPPHYTSLPAIIYDVYHGDGETQVKTHIWERTGTRFAFNRRVAILPTEY